MKDYIKEWEDIVKSDDLIQKLEHHLASFLTENQECKSLLTELVKRVTNVKIAKVKGKEQLEVTLDGKLDDKPSEYFIRLGPPFEGEPSPNIPKSYLKVVAQHNQIILGCKYGSAFFGGLDKKGNYGCGTWEFDAILENRRDNKAFLENLAKVGYVPKDISGPIDYGQNWIVINPTQHLPNGEPTWSFVSHGDCIVNAPLSQQLDFGPILLRLWIQFILEKEIFSEVYN